MILFISSVGLKNKKKDLLGVLIKFESGGRKKKSCFNNLLFTLASELKKCKAKREQ